MKSVFGYESASNSGGVKPTFFEIISDADKKMYEELRFELSSSERKHKRYKRVASFNDALSLIHGYCIRCDQNDWKRCLICGVCWIGFDLAINTRQLRLLINKCKSSINGALSKMGYGNAIAAVEAAAELSIALPILKGNYLELRMWTIRRRLLFSPGLAQLSAMMTPYQNADTPSFVSPQPSYFMNLIDEKPKTEVEKVFGAISSNPSIPEIDVDPDPSTMFDVESCNILSDPCCCAPREWYTLVPDDDDVFTFA